MSTIPFSRHGKERRKLMKVTEDQVQRVVEDPEITYADERDGGNRRVYVGGDLIVVVDTVTGYVVTVKWRGAVGRDENGGPL